MNSLQEMFDLLLTSFKVMINIINWLKPQFWSFHGREEGEAAEWAGGVGGEPATNAVDVKDMTTFWYFLKLIICLVVPKAY
jgi:hypothetical protein